MRRKGDGESGGEGYEGLGPKSRRASTLPFILSHAYPLVPAATPSRRAAASEAGEETALGAWFLTRRNELPGGDLPEDSGYLPV